MKRKPNSVRAMRALRKQIKMLADRLAFADRVVQRSVLYTNVALDAQDQHYVRCASKLGYTCEVSIDGNGKTVLSAVKRVSA